METSWASGAAGRGLVAWIRSPLRVTLTAETWTSLILAAGVVLRVLEYTDNRQLYMDESALIWQTWWTSLSSTSAPSSRKISLLRRVSSSWSD